MLAVIQFIKEIFRLSCFSVLKPLINQRRAFCFYSSFFVKSVVSLLCCFLARLRISFLFYNSCSHVERLICIHVSVQNENRTLWKLGTLPPGLITFYSTTKPLDKSWHVLGLGYNPSINRDEIRNAAVVHFNGNMKPWLDIAMNQFRSIWTKYVDYDNEFVQSCNFGL